jgi:hypothetical protein
MRKELTLAHQIVNAQHILLCAIADYVRLTGRTDQYGPMTESINSLTGVLLSVIEGSDAKVAVPPYAAQ